MRQRVMIAIALAGRARDPDRRRADHGARRHRAGPDPRGARPAPRAPRDGGPAHHPRPRHRGRPGRPGGGDVRRPDRGGGRRPRSCSPGRRIRTPGRCSPRFRGSPARCAGSRRSRGTVPPPDAWPAGCRFRPRCPEALRRRASETPPLLPVGPGPPHAVLAGGRAPMTATARGARSGEALRRAADSSAPGAAGARGRRRVASTSAGARRSALVGESGCGKSTVGRTILRLRSRPAGTARFDGTDVFALDRGALRALRRRMQIIFQDPYSSLDPADDGRAASPKGIEIHRLAPKAEIGAPGRRAARGGRPRSRATPGAIPTSSPAASGSGSASPARSRSSPTFIVCDEPVSALDVSVQAQVLNLLADLQRHRGLSYLFIAHDLAVVRQIAQRIAVMYLGQDRRGWADRSAPRRSAASLHRGPALRRPGARPEPAADPDRARRRRPSPTNPPPGCRSTPAAFIR